MGATVDLIRQTFGKLTVVSRNGSSRHKKALWLCQCECGRTATIGSGNLRSGRSQSCGVCPYETHGLTHHRLYSIYKGIKSRCNRIGQKGFKNYGGRGITLEDGFSTFEKFYAWAIANGYQSNLTIERINNEGNYSPDNCTWKTRLEQSHNRRTTKLTPDLVLSIRKHIENGKLQQKQIALLFNISHQTVSNIKTKRVWSSV